MTIERAGDVADGAEPQKKLLTADALAALLKQKNEKEIKNWLESCSAEQLKDCLKGIIQKFVEDSSKLDCIDLLVETAVTDSKKKNEKAKLLGALTFALADLAKVESNGHSEEKLKINSRKALAKINRATRHCSNELMAMVSDNPEYRLMGTKMKSPRHLIHSVANSSGGIIEHVYLGSVPTLEELKNLGMSYQYAKEKNTVLFVINCQEYGEVIDNYGKLAIVDGSEIVSDIMPNFKEKMKDIEKNCGQKVKIEYHRVFGAGMRDHTAIKACDGQSATAKELEDELKEIHQKADAFKKQGKNVVFYHHCFGGVARSATMAIVHLIYSYKFGLDEALNSVCGKREIRLNGERKGDLSKFKDGQRKLLLNFYADLITKEGADRKVSDNDIKLLYQFWNELDNGRKDAVKKEYPEQFAKAMVDAMFAKGTFNWSPKMFGCGETSCAALEMKPLPLVTAGASS